MIVLLVEDEQKIAHFVRRALEFNNFTVEEAGDGEEAMKKIGIHDYDLVILDVMLPKKDGLEVCREIRKMELKVPILMLTAKIDRMDRVTGLDTGADDYLGKPFDVEELLARVRALLRRGTDLKMPTLKVDDLELDPASNEVRRGDQTISLTSKEYRILEYLMRNAGKVCTRTMINEHIWGFNYVKSNVIDVYMKRLRDKIDRDHTIKLIHTIRNTGYKLRANG